MNSKWLRTKINEKSFLNLKIQMNENDSSNNDFINKVKTHSIKNNPLEQWFSTFWASSPGKRWLRIAALEISVDIHIIRTIGLRLIQKMFA